MEHTFELDRTNDICTVTITGEFHSPQDGFRMQYFALQFFAEHDCHLFLFDLTGAEIFTGTSEAYDIANPKGELAEGLRRLRGALLYSILTDHEYFLENVAVNHGFSIKVFDQHADAIEWLKQNG